MQQKPKEKIFNFKKEKFFIFLFLIELYFRFFFRILQPNKIQKK